MGIAMMEKGKTMSDYIKKSDAVKVLFDDCIRYVFPATAEPTAEFIKLNNAINLLRLYPSADVAPVRHGWWVVIDAEEPRRYGCSECKRLSWNMENYCGNCGAKMDGESDE